MKFSDEAKAYLHRYLCRCDNHTGVSVNQFRQYFIDFFIRLRETASSEEEKEWFETAEVRRSGVRDNLT